MIVCCLGVALAGCRPGPKIVPAYDPARSPMADAVEAAPEQRVRSPEAEAMHRWLLDLGALRDAVVQGDLPAVQIDAQRWVAGLDGDVVEWKDSLIEIRAEAERLATAESLQHAAVSVAKLAGDCGRCHEARGVVELVAGGLPPDRDPPPSGHQPDEMARHQWAAVRMWEGLVAPSVPRWIRGTTMFAILPDCPSERDAQTEAVRRCERPRAIARRARRSDNRVARVSLYGRLLTTCADCHAQPRAVTRASRLAPHQ